MLWLAWQGDKFIAHGVLFKLMRDRNLHEDKPGAKPFFLYGCEEESSELAGKAVCAMLLCSLLQCHLTTCLVLLMQAGTVAFHHTDHCLHLFHWLCVQATS